MSQNTAQMPAEELSGSNFEVVQTIEILPEMYESKWLGIAVR